MLEKHKNMIIPTTYNRINAICLKGSLYSSVGMNNFHYRNNIENDCQNIINERITQMY